jgi:hypothetical protein
MSGYIGSSQPVAFITDSIDITSIGTDAVGADEIKANAVTSSELAANAVTTTRILDGAVTAAKIDSNVELGGPSLGTSSVIRTNAQTISENITIPSTSNGMSAGPITIADTYTVTVNGNWTII